MKKNIKASIIGMVMLLAIIVSGIGRVAYAIPIELPIELQKTEEKVEENTQEEKVVYLTFDDGPTTGVTEKILDILKEQDIKATFFIVGKEIIDREAVLKRIYEEGHTMGLHTYSHNFKKIYQSPESFMDEMEQAEAKINEVLGTQLDLKIIRFPGGSAGRLTDSFLEKLHQNNYRIYDWNVNLEDGVKPDLPPYQLVANAKKCSRDTTVRIILGHCNKNNKTTPQALPDIIAYYKKEGYSFRPITENTKEFFYRIRKQE